MIPPQLVAEIRRLFEIEGWRSNTIVRHLKVHHSTVKRALEREGIESERAPRASRLDPFLNFLKETLERHPRLPASVLWEMARRRGYQGGVDHFRHRIAELELRPRRVGEASWSCARCQASRPRSTGRLSASGRSSAESVGCSPS